MDGEISLTFIEGPTSAAIVNVGRFPGTRVGTFPSMSRRCCLRYSAHAFSSARVWSFEAISNRPNANIKARTLTWGSAARPVVPHLRQVMIGVWMLRPVRIRCRGIQFVS